MCLPDFECFKQIDKENALIGYRNWRNNINSLELKSESQDYIWTPEYRDISHEVKDKNSGIYAYNYAYAYNNYNYNNNYNNYAYAYNYNNNYNNYNYNNNYNNYNYNNNYYLSGIVKQFGKVAIHKIGQRSEFCEIDTLFYIKLSDAIGPQYFLDWIISFNKHIEDIAKKYNIPNLISWQDFIESKKEKK